MPQRWLAAQEAAIPFTLAERLHGALSTASAGVPAPERMLAAGTEMLAGVLAAPTMTRAHALDVLAADALVTGAFEAAASEPALFRERTTMALELIGQVGVAVEGA